MYKIKIKLVNAGLVKWPNISLPRRRNEFESRIPLQKT